jgi:cytochrome c oxidase subunit II
VLVLALAAAGCAGIQTVTDARGPQAASINELWWLFIIVCTVVWLAVTVALFLALFRRGRRPIEAPPTDGEPAKVRVVAYATVATVAVLIVFLVYSIVIGHRVSRLPGEDQPSITVEVVGHQWWWQVRYLDDESYRTFTTANELRIPVGRPVILHLKSRDVIHSFWVPNLHGKMDLVPGRTNVTWIQADEPGVFRGQCGEFCGLQHAKMAFMVVAVPVEEFEAWREAYRQPAPPRTDLVAQRGEEVFMQAQCSMCHTIRGTGAWGRVGPDLTRIGARRTIAAGTLPNTRGNMGGWILDPQHIKPGNFMPPTNLDPESLQALLVYLESLK